MKTIILFVLCFVFVDRAAAQRLSEETGNIATVESLYVSGQYLSAELEARRLREQSGLTDSVIIEVERWIAFSLIAQGKITAARERFIGILRIDEGFTLDPVLTSPKILSVFNDAKARYSAAQRSAVPESAQVMTLPVRRIITYRAMLFPGWEQLFHGRTSAGYVYLGTGAATLTAGLVFELLRSDARSKYLNARTPADIASTYDSYNTYRKGEFYSFVAFGVVYFASQADLFSNTEISLQPNERSVGGGQLRLSFRW